MYKFEFTLKQHTPIIHFQHDQIGATLRASEVKPKLDRFLITRIGQGNYDAGISISTKKGWLVGNSDHPALDYKLKLIQNDVKQQPAIKNPNYFGNIGLKPDDAKKGHIYSENEVMGVILFPGKFHTDNHFEVDLMTFFLTNNFGCRSGKGAGSYTLSSCNKNTITVDENIKFLKKYLNNANIIKDRILFTDYLLIESKDKSVIFQTIDYYWKRLKTGINYTQHNDFQKKCTGEYKKSFLFNFIQTNTWEKRWLKENFMGLPPLVPNTEPKFTRALLGLSDKYSFMDKSKLKKCVCNSVSTKIAHTFKFEVDVSSDQIERIPSPLIFKPIVLENQTYIFLLYEKDYNKWDVLGKDFIFKMQDLQYPLHLGTLKNDKLVPDYVRHNDRLNLNYLLNRHSTFLKRNNMMTDQSTELKDFFSYSIPSERTLQTPENGVDLKRLLCEYHSSLGSSFIALDFRNNTITKVNINSL
jgi:hypothetical protein